MTNFTFGSDPEFMLLKNGKYVSAIGVVPGTKDERHPIGDNSFYYDNVMAECSIKPANTRQEAIDYIGLAIKQFAGLVKPVKLIAQASQEYPAAELADPKAMEIGCSPELCAYEMAIVKPPQDQFKNGTLRTSGGHIHIGTQFPKTDEHCAAIFIRLMDLFVGLPSIYIDKDPTSAKRKELYGKAGRFRLPDHGAEYRTMGNFWLSSPKLVGLVYDLTEFTVDFCETGKWKSLWEVNYKYFNSDAFWAKDGDFKNCQKCIGYDAVGVRSVVDTMDVVGGQKHLPLLKKLMPRTLYKQMMAATEVKKPYDLYAEWGI